jgi:hypothetical protein
MEEGPTRQGFIFSPDNPIYHLAANESLSLCGLWLHGTLEQRRRRDDRRLSAEKPIGQLVALCSRCERLASGTSEPERPAAELLSRSRLVDIVV